MIITTILCFNGGDLMVYMVVGISNYHRGPTFGCACINDDEIISGKVLWQGFKSSQKVLFGLVK